MAAKVITEKDGVHAQWYEDAKKQTVDTLPSFIRHLTHDYKHDYGTICHAIAAGAIGAAWAVEHSPEGGITGLQKGAIMWQFIRHWMDYDENEPMRLVKFDEMLYPQYERTFTSISTSTWEWIQKQAKNKLSETDGHVHPAVKKHWESIVAGRVPFGMTIKGKE